MKRDARDRGSAIVEFALIVPLVLLMFVTIAQIAVASYVRTTLTASAAEGARAAALADADLRTAENRTRRSLADSMVGDVVNDVDARIQRINGIRTVAVTIDARLPLFGLIGPTTQTVEAHALLEGSS